MTRLTLAALLLAFPAQADPPAAPASAAPPSAAAPVSAPAPIIFATQGVHYFKSNTPSPLAGAGSRDPLYSNRVVLDDAHTQVQIDVANQRVLITNTHRYEDEAIIADFLLLGRGRTTDGKELPVAVHLKVKKEGGKTEHEVHAHVTTRRSFAASLVDTYTVAVSDGVKQRLVMTPEVANRAVLRPDSSDKLGRALLKFKDHLEGKKGDRTQAGYALADVSLGIGRGPLRKYVLRAQIVSLDAANAPLIAGGDVAKMLNEGAWELRLKALSSLLPADSVKRDLMLMGIADIPILAPVKAKGLEKNQSLVFTLRAGQGSVTFDGKTAPLPNAVDVARAYLEFNFLGLILTEQARLRTGG